MRDPLENCRFLLSAGPMRTAMDAVRFIQNRSSGAMGLAIAQEAARRGATVRVLLGPVGEAMASRFAPFSVTRYESSKQYGAALEKLFPECDVFLSLAAVLDFEVEAVDGKIARENLGQRLELAITPVPDFSLWASNCKRPDQKVVAFAAEVDPGIVERAESKRAKKNADAIVANPVASGLGPDASENELWVLRHGQAPVHLGPAAKNALAGPLLRTLFPFAQE